VAVTLIEKFESPRFARDDRLILDRAGLLTEHWG